MEADILKVIDYNLEIPTLHSCLETNSEMLSKVLTKDQLSHLNFLLEAQSILHGSGSE
jgi:hypothetical protein